MMLCPIIHQKKEGRFQVLYYLSLEAFDFCLQVFYQTVEIFLVLCGKVSEDQNR
jgi:hypothetical protein